MPYVKNHLVTLNRFPNGIVENGFFQKQIPDYAPEWLNRHEVILKKGEYQTLILLEKQDDLIYLANQAVIEIHSWLSSIQNINMPDKIVFDLDPSIENFDTLRFVAKKLKKLLEKKNLNPFIMTTGSRGYHIITPIKPKHNFELIHEFAKNIAKELAQEHYDIITNNVKKEGRENKIFIDYLRNSYGQTSIAPYSLRPRENAPIATPISWDELDKVEPQKFNIFNIFGRLNNIENPWSNFYKARSSLFL